MAGEPGAASLANIRAGNAGLIYANGEWMAHEGVTDNSDGTFTMTNVRRAIFGTRPRQHAGGSRVWFLESDLLGTGDLGGELLESGTAFYKFLDQVGDTQRNASAATEANLVLNDIADRPLRPRDLNIDAGRDEAPYNVTTDTSLSLTWISSNRLADQVTFENDATETPDQTEQYDLEVWVDGVQNMTLSQTNVTSPHVVNMTGVTGDDGEIRLYSRRTVGDLKTSVDYAVYPFILGATADSTLITADQTNVTADMT